MYTHKLVTAVSVLLAAAILIMALPAFGESEKNDPESIANGVISLQMEKAGVSSYDEWISKTLVESAGGGSEWYIISLKQFGYKVDGALYAKALSEALSEGRVLSAAETLKFALALYMSGDSDNAYIKTALNEAVGAQGIMSYVYGLHLLNNGLKSYKLTTEEAVNALLSLRKSDGGWAVMGNYSDTDVTAMTIQALAPHYQTNDEVKNAVDEALDFLKTKQLDDGAFLGFGANENLESTAQVIIALCSLGIDPVRDPDFIKNGYSAYDGLMLFHMDDGGFCHVLSSDFNSTATVQAFMACVSMWRLQNGFDGIYLYSPMDTRDTTFSPAKNESANASKKAGLSYKPFAIGAAFTLALIVSVVLWLKGKRNYKNYLFTAIIFAVVSTIVLFTDFSSVSAYYSGEKTEKTDIIGSVTMSIRCDTISAYSDEKSYIPPDGTVLAETRFDISKGDSAFDILTEAAREYSLQLDNQGSSISMVYVKGIQYIYELEFGEQSGWMFYVNGVAPSVNAGEYKLKDGDVVQWMYSLNIGADLKDYIYTPAE